MQNPVTPASAAPPRPAPSATGAGRLDFIDVLRGLACLWVVLHHVNFYIVGKGAEHLFVEDHAVLTPLTALAKLGYLGVHLFLVLSGFCLFYPVVRKQGVEGAQVQNVPFFKRRAWRILPPYYAAMAVSLGLMLVPALRDRFNDLGGRKDIPLHALMLHNLHPDTIFSINDVFWSLALESQLYLLFPLFVWLGRKRGLWTVVAAGFAVSALFQLAAYLKMGQGPDFSTARVWQWSLPARCFEFICGMAAAALITRPHPALARWAAVAVAVCLPYALWSGYYLDKAYLPLRDQAWGVVWGALIVVCWHATRTRARDEQITQAARKGLGARVWEALVWLGTISYSIYLVHLPVFRIIRPWIWELDWPVSHMYLLSALLVPLTVLVSYGFFLLFERPFLNRSSRGKQASPTPASVSASEAGPLPSGARTSPRPGDA